MINFIKGIGLKAWAYIVIFFTFLAFIYKVYDAGGDAREVRGMKKTLETVKERDKNEIIIDTLDSDDVNDRLREGGWIRD